MTFEEGRALFPVLERIAYLNAGTFGPLPRPVADAVTGGVARDLAEGRTGMPYFEETIRLRAEVRQQLAGLVGAAPDQVALTTSTSEGCAIVLRGLRLEPGDEIVTTTDEHFGLLGPLAASVATVVVVEPDPERILAAVTARTRLIATSQVLWTTGAVLPLAELRERSGVPVLADGAQSVGAIPASADGLDYLTISGQKWLCGPDTTGALVVRDPESLTLTSPSYFAQTRHEPDGTFVAHPDARRFESGWWSSGALQGMLAALALRPEWAYDRAAEAASRCRALLAPRVEVVTPSVAATLVAFRPEEAPADVVVRLHAAGVHVRELPGRGLVRASCGWWTSDDDLERLVAALGPVAPGQAASAALRSPSSPAIGCSAAITFAMCSSSSRPRSSAPAYTSSRCTPAANDGCFSFFFTDFGSSPSRPVGRTRPQAWTNPDSSSQANSVRLSGVSRGSSRCSACERTASISTSG